MIYIKQTGNRFYRESRLQMRSFPIKAAEAQELIRAGEAELVDRFLWERDPEPSVISENPAPSASNVIDITGRIKQRQEKAELDKAIDKFKSDYLPFLSKQDMLDMVNAGEYQAEVMSRICMRIDLERGQLSQ